MSNYEEDAREFWCASSLVRRSKPDSITRRVAIGRLLDSQDTVTAVKIVNRFSMLLAEHLSEALVARFPQSAS